MATYQDPLAWRIQFCRERSKKEKKTEEEIYMVHAAINITARVKTGRHKEWTGMGFGDFLRAAEDRERWRGIAATSSVVPRRPSMLRAMR